jgi:hypothetical protein
MGCMTAPTVTGTDVELKDISCASQTFCVAVGVNFVSLTERDIVVFQWNGTSWASVSAPDVVPGYDNFMSGVSCVSTSFCVAIGTWQSTAQQQPLLERWDGTAWTVAAFPPGVGNSGTGLKDVSCVTDTFCLATGAAPVTGQPTIYRWDGNTWAAELMASPGSSAQSSIGSVYCVSTAFCVADGAGPGGTLIEHWDGTQWTVDASANPAAGATVLSNGGMTCVSVSMCFAVGYGDYGAGGSLPSRTLIEQYGSPA